VRSVVRVYPDPPNQKRDRFGKSFHSERNPTQRWKRELKFRSQGAIAQLGEHLLCKQGVVGSIPTGSTRKQEGEEEKGLLE
jgi:hypothetical protein